MVLFRAAAFQIGGHGDIDLLGMRQPQIVHVADEIAFRKRAAEPRIEALLLGDAGHRQAAIIMGGIQQTGVGQREELQMHRAIQRTRIALLEIRAPAAADQQASPVNAMLSSSST